MWSELDSLSVILAWEGEDRGPQRKLATETSRIGQLWVLLKNSASMNLVGEQSAGWGVGIHIHSQPHAHSTGVPTYMQMYTHPVHTTHMENTLKKIKTLNYVSVVGISTGTHMR